MSTATWSAARTTGAAWRATVRCAHAETSAMIIFRDFDVTADAVVAVAQPSKAFAFHLATTQCDCTAVQTPVVP
jgi:hypothetical protein